MRSHEFRIEAGRVNYWTIWMPPVPFGWNIVLHIHHFGLRAPRIIATIARPAAVLLSSYFLLAWWKEKDKMVENETGMKSSVILTLLEAGADRKIWWLGDKH